MNISYDLNNYYSLKGSNRIFYYSKEDLERQEKQKYEKLVQKAFKTRKSMCEGYAHLYKKLCSHLGLTSFTIEGYTRSSPDDIGAFTNNKDHAWNVVFYDNEWHLLDVTWGAGYAISKKKWVFSFKPDYFNSPPDLFINRHFPADSKWQLLETPITKQGFASKPLIYKMVKESEIVISLHQLGDFNLKPSEKNVFIHFKKLPKKSGLSYMTGRNWIKKKIKIDYKKNGTAIGYIKYRNKGSNIISLIDEDKVFAEFVVKQ